jgi:nitroimidazol reductase NimA-like FMN-containing flavoprotein (pyridoxamine 5'-phosphate oxidase superfamily)
MSEGAHPMSEAPSERTTVRRKPERAHYDRQTVYEILDSGLICHIGFVVDGRPAMIPTTYGRHEDRLYVHGSSSNGTLHALASGTEACVTVSLIDGLVLGRSPMRHSMNYRSVVIFGRFEQLDARDAKLRAIQAIHGHIVPGRLATLREPTDSELARASFMSLSLAECSAKVRAGGPKADPDDDRGVWAGVVPIRRSASTPIPADQAAADLDLPDHVARLTAQGAGG